MFSVEKKLISLDNSTNYLHIVSSNGLQMIEGKNYSFLAASKGYKRYQTMNKGLI